MKHMVIDTANLLFRVASARMKFSGTRGSDGSPEEEAGLALHMALQTVNKYFKQFKPHQVVLTFEGQNNWRKEYTKSSDCVSGRVYKANRVKNDSMIPFFELMNSFEDLVRNNTTAVCLSNNILEGDDLFAGYVQRFANTDEEIIGISGDKDFAQLLKYNNFTLINPDNGKPRTLESVCGVNDPTYFMFEKAVRGDKGDNVFTAYPRVRTTRLKACLSDEYELIKLMNETWSFTDPTTGEVKTFVVGDLFNENILLMDLTAQPDHIRSVIHQTIDEALKNRGSWNFFKFNKFCGKYGLKQIAENSEQYAKLFNLSEKQAIAQLEADEKSSIMQF